MTQNALIEMEDVHKVYVTETVETHALSEVRLQISQGEFVAIVGPSGCGKTTLLSMIGLLDVPTTGSYRLNGESVETLSPQSRARMRNRVVGFVFQSFNLIGDLTVFENVELPLVYRDMRASVRKQRVQQALEQVDMMSRTSHYPAQLSGGQQQRVAVARALVGEPLILLADEPTGNLDSRNGGMVMDLLKELHQRGTTVCMVTHDPRATCPTRGGRCTCSTAWWWTRAFQMRFPCSRITPEPISMVGQETNPARVLIADDQPDVLEALRLLLKPEGFAVCTAASPKQALAAIASTRFDAALIDLNYTRDTTSGGEGLDLLAEIRAADGDLPVVVMTAWGSVEVAVEAMRRGARDFVQKPWDNNRVLTILRTQVELARALRRGRRLEAENRLLRTEANVEMIATSRAMQPVLEMISRIGPSDANVLITGEHGTGKEVVAHALHGASSRSDRPMVTVNLGGLADGVFVSELFGHVRGAFTDARSDRIGRFEMAHEATLFLDEIANVPVAEQSKLLRVLEGGELQRLGESRTRVVDVRILSATNADLETEVAAGQFREDLLFRLNTVRLQLPPLRERGADIPLLARHFLGRCAARYRKNLRGFDGAADEALARHPWPGNVRELAHVVESGPS